MELGIATVASVTVICYLLGLIVKALPWDGNRYIPILCGLAGVCAVNYIVFSVATLYYIGYPLFIAYAAFALRAYLRRYGRLYRKS